jgi:hypothetical protein
MQLGRAEFARICDGKAPSLDSVLILGQFVMGQLKVESVPASALAERTVDAVGEILGAVAEAAEAAEDLKSLAANYAAEYAPVLRAAISGVEAVATAVTAAAAPGAAPRWKSALMALLGMFQVCMSTRAVAAVNSPQRAASAAAVDVAKDVAHDVIEAVPSVEELTHDIRLVVDAKAPPSPHAPTPPPTPDQTPESNA